MTDKKTKVIISGINGRMGKATFKALIHHPDFEIVGVLGKKGSNYIGLDAGLHLGLDEANIAISADLQSLLSAQNHNCADVLADVLIDFTKAENAYETVLACLKNKIAVVIGTSNLSKENLEEIAKLAKSNSLGALFIPNFSLGAILMMEFSKQAAKYFQNVEIIEMHGTSKPDAPSGTSVHTAKELEKINNSKMNKYNQDTNPDERLIYAGARGATLESGIRIHSVRLPGLLAQQSVLFGGQGEMLTIKHDSFSTDSFISGIIMSLKAASKLSGLSIGLESVLAQNKNTNSNQDKRQFQETL
jgi:4-hydroxy-tetrahydrodipicolinate reductase